MRAGCVLIAGAMSACNWFYQLDETHIIANDAGPDLEDEDDDGVNNETDNCPGLKNSDQKDDGDHDGVGDVCDPYPMTPGDEIVARIMFNRPDLDRTGFNGTGWQFHTSYIEQPTPGANAEMYTVFVPERVVTVDLRIKITFDLDASFNRAGIALDGPGGPGCFLAKTTGLGGAVFARGNGEPGANTVLPDDVPLLLRATFRRNMDVGCLVGNIATGVTVPSTRPDGVGVYTNQDAARVDYIIIYSSPGP